MNLKFLIVDDQLMVARAMARSLDRVFPDCEAVLQSSGPDALITLDVNSSFDVIISDFSMPGMNGAEFLHEVARRHPTIALVLCSGGAPHLTDRQMLNACPVGTQFVPKPFENNELAAAVRCAISEKLTA